MQSGGRGPRNFSQNGFGTRLGLTSGARLLKCRASVPTAPGQPSGSSWMHVAATVTGTVAIGYPLYSTYIVCGQTLEKVEQLGAKFEQLHIDLVRQDAKFGEFQRDLGRIMTHLKVR